MRHFSRDGSLGLPERRRPPDSEATGAMLGELEAVGVRSVGVFFPFRDEELVEPRVIAAYDEFLAVIDADFLRCADLSLAVMLVCDLLLDTFCIAVKMRGRRSDSTFSISNDGRPVSNDSCLPTSLCRSSTLATS